MKKFRILSKTALIKSGLETLHARRHAACAKSIKPDDPNRPLIHDLHKEKHRFKNPFIVSSCLSCRKNTTLDFFTTLDFLPSPSTFNPHPRLFTLTLDFLPSPSTLDPRHSTLDKNLNSPCISPGLIVRGLRYYISHILKWKSSPFCASVLLITM